MAAKSKSNEIHLTRVYDAPVQIVWDAWTDPDKAAHWWGPRGFSLTTHSKDLRPGGTWRYTMHGPDGVDYPNIAKYLEVEPYTKLVYDHGATDDRPPLFRVTVVFSEIEGKTQMNMRMTLPTPEAAEDARIFIKKAGGNATWDRLAEYLEKESSGKETFVIARAFESPIDVVFEMWTNPEHFSKWLSPTGSTMEFIRSDIRPGGSTFFYMTSPDTEKLYARAEYLTIEKPNRIVYVQQFCDQNENIARNSMVPVWPEGILTTVTFTAEDTNRTRISVKWEPHGSTTHEELDAFVKMRGSMTQGWTGSFDKLEDLLMNR